MKAVITEPLNSLRAVPAAPQRPKLPDFMDLPAEFNEKPAPYDMVIHGLIAGQVGAIVAPGGTGKSIFALQLAVKVATGFASFSLPTAKSRVMYFAGEDPREVFQHRLYDMHLRQDVKRACGENLKIAVLDDPIFVTNKDVQDIIIDAAAAAGGGFKFIIFDTLRMFHELDENDAGAMNRVIVCFKRIARETGAAVIFIHHSSKAAAMGGQGDQQQAARGSSVLTDNIRWQSFLVGMTAKEAADRGIDEADRKKYVRFGISKLNFAMPIDDIWFERGDGGILMHAALSGQPRQKVEPDYGFGGDNDGCPF